jgi:hypothetical protein
MTTRARTRAFLAAAAIAVVFVGDSAAPHSLTVPFFRDEGSTMGSNGPQTGAAGVITVTNTRNQPITMHLVYALNDVTGDAQVQQARSYDLDPRESVSWRPSQDDPAEGSGRFVPNVLPGSGNFGSVAIYWIGGPEMTGALVGRYLEFSSSRSMMHVLAETGRDY